MTCSSSEDLFSVWTLHALDPLVHAVATCFGKVFIIQNDEISCSITE